MSRKAKQSGLTSTHLHGLKKAGHWFSKKKQHVLFFDPISLEKDHATNERITFSNFSIFLKIGLILSRQ